MSAQGVATEESKNAYTYLTWPSLRYEPLRTRVNRTIAVIVAVPALLAVACAVGPYVTGSRFGLIPVGNAAACRDFPYGSCMLVIPGPVRDGDFVLARPTEQGHAQSLVVTRAMNGKLSPTKGAGTTASFEPVGRILCCLPTHKAFGWLDREGAAPSAAAKPEGVSYRDSRTAQGRQLLRAEMDRLAVTGRLVEPRASYLKGYTYSRDKLQVISGRNDARAGFVLSDKPVNVLAVAVSYTGREGLLWVRLGGEKIAAVSSPYGPQLIVLGHPVKCRIAGLVRPKLAPGDREGDSEVKSVQFWVQK
jgi:hypothetical protein